MAPASKPASWSASSAGNSSTSAPTSRAAVALARRPTMRPTLPSLRIVPVPAMARPRARSSPAAVGVRHEGDHQAVRRAEREVAVPRAGQAAGEAAADGDVERLDRRLDDVDAAERQRGAGELVDVAGRRS